MMMIKFCKLCFETILHNLKMEDNYKMKTQDFTTRNFDEKRSTSCKIIGIVVCRVIMIMSLDFLMCNLSRSLAPAWEEWMWGLNHAPWAYTWHHVHESQINGTNIARERGGVVGLWEEKGSFSSAFSYTWRTKDQDQAWSNKLWCPKTARNLHFDLHELLYVYIG